MSKKIKIGIIGVGNAASGLLQGIEYYRQNLDKQNTGIMHKDICGYKVTDIVPCCAFDIASKKVGKDLSDALKASPNMVNWSELKKSGVVVCQGPRFDSVGSYVLNTITPVKELPLKKLKEEIINEIEQATPDMLINYLPVGSQKAVEFWADISIETKTPFINTMPVFIASNPAWEAKFKKARIPIIGDDMKGALGATIMHRILVKLIRDRGAKLVHTYQLNVGGNTDFQNMLERERLKNKKISKTESVQSQLESRLDDNNIHIGPSDYVPFLKNTKVAFIYLKGEMWAGIPYEIDVKLTVDDKANAATIIAEAIRLLKVASENNIGGALLGPSAYLMKHPPKQMSDEAAKVALESFMNSYTKK